VDKPKAIIKIRIRCDIVNLLVEDQYTKRN